ncbi:MAG: 5-formyltetrahydrofolate cyclo-ligase [Gammaproteobacteria bacterium]
MSSRSSLRQGIRLKRRQLNTHERQLAAKQLTERLIRSPLFLNSQRIAAYLPVQGEIDPTPLIEKAWKMHKQIYLPVLSPIKKNTLWFVRYEPNSRMTKNRLGIPEPVINHRHRIPTKALDIVLTPLVGFDKHGNRLGMGGGYYDRSFSFLASRRYYLKPRLIGLAYEFQQVPELIKEAWDIPLDAIVTENKFTHFKK